MPAYSSTLRPTQSQPMELIFSDSPFPTRVTKSLFLAGPSPRRADEHDWRHEALAALEQCGFDGTVYIPIPKNKFYGAAKDEASWTYVGQISQECAGRARADLVAFWVPRVIDRTKSDLGMPAFTTNIEFGEDLHSGKLLYGRPAFAEKCRYLDKRVEELGLPVFTTLPELMQEAVKKLGSGSLREAGEVQVPLFVWQSEMFQSWYRNLKQAGNRLDDLKVLHSFRVGGHHLFSYLIGVNVWVEAEQRHKSNEIVFARKDLSTLVVYHRESATGSTNVALVREFRSTVNNATGYVYELAGGSSVNPNLDPRVNAQQELNEELGLLVEDLERFRPVGVRQLTATLSSHRAHVYAVHLDSAEWAQLQKNAERDQPFGMTDDSERTYAVITQLSDIFKLPLDYSMLGMLFEALSDTRAP